jgi:hypothetical protein
MRTSNLDKVLGQVTGAECQEAAEELDGAPTVTAANWLVSLNHPPEATRAVGGSLSCGH